MPHIKTADYKPPFHCRNGHTNTILTYYLRNNPPPPYDTVILDTPDEDIIKVDRLLNNNSRAVFLLHGLEGSSQSQYIAHTARLLHNESWDVYCLNFRGCGEVDNKLLTMYHSGFTEDVNHVISLYESQYDSIGIVGFSLGGNVTMKYLSDGIYPLSDKIVAACGVSVPCDLHKGSLHIGRKSNYFYEKSFIKSLTGKIIKKKAQFPDQVDLELLNQVKTLYDFDNLFTGPIHGFKDASDYYAQCNCLQFLKDISKPTMMINAVDDPFLPESCYPVSIAEENENLFLLTPKYGGHVGFYSRNEYFWNEYMIKNFLDDPTYFL